MAELTSREQALALCETLYDKKALDIRAINVTDKTVLAEWFVVCSGRVSAQVKTLCDELEDKGPGLGLTVLRKEGYHEGRWIVLDFGHILVHIFHPEEREYYNLERLWADDPANCVNYSQEKGE